MTDLETIRRLQADNAALGYVLNAAMDAIGALVAKTPNAHALARHAQDARYTMRAHGGARFLELLQAARVVSAFGLVGTEMDEALIALRQTVAAIDKEGTDGR
jgi:hypothetical protein